MARKSQAKPLPPPTHIEAMCNVCHGPLQGPRRGTHRTRIACEGACASYWASHLSKDGLLSYKYECIRLLHAYRRRQLLTQMLLDTWVKKLTVDSDVDPMVARLTPRKALDNKKDSTPTDGQKETT